MSMTDEEFLKLRPGDWVKTSDDPSMPDWWRGKTLEVARGARQGWDTAYNVLDIAYVVWPFENNNPKILNHLNNDVDAKYIGKYYWAVTSLHLSYIVKNKESKQQNKSIYSLGPDGETLGPSGLKWL